MTSPEGFMRRTAWLPQSATYSVPFLQHPPLPRRVSRRRRRRGRGRGRGLVDCDARWVEELGLRSAPVEASALLAAEHDGRRAVGRHFAHPVRAPLGDVQRVAAVDCDAKGRAERVLAWPRRLAFPEEGLDLVLLTADLADLQGGQGEVQMARGGLWCPVR